MDNILGDPALPKLVDELEDSFPTVTPSPKDSIADIMYKAGQRSVVEYIKQKLED